MKVKKQPGRPRLDVSANTEGENSNLASSPMTGSNAGNDDDEEEEEDEEEENDDEDDEDEDSEGGGGASGSSDESDDDDVRFHYFYFKFYNACFQTLAKFNFYAKLR